jgi:hypothetical protein
MTWGCPGSDGHFIGVVPYSIKSVYDVNLGPEYRAHMGVSMVYHLKNAPQSELKLHGFRWRQWDGLHVDQKEGIFIIFSLSQIALGDNPRGLSPKLRSWNTISAGIRIHWPLQIIPTSSSHKNTLCCNADW